MKNHMADTKNVHPKEENPIWSYILAAVVGGGFWVLFFYEATR